MACGWHYMIAFKYIFLVSAFTFATGVMRMINYFPPCKPSLTQMMCKQGDVWFCMVLGEHPADTVFNDLLEVGEQNLELKPR